VLSALLILGCSSRGLEPPHPTEDFRASIVGVVAQSSPPSITLASGVVFPPTGVAASRLKNWPASPASEEDVARPGSLLLGGQRVDGTWWYELAGFGGPNSDGCWSVYGGSFDEGDSVWFSSGLRVPKAATFEVRPIGQKSVQPFPGHAADSVCLDTSGRALYFDLFVGH
jgi:hypothetical protein